MKTRGTIMPYPTEPLMNKGELPDPFALTGGGRVTTPAEWPDRARQWRNLIAEVEYGGLPPEPDAVEVETLCHSSVLLWPGAPLLFSYRIHCLGGERPFSFCVRMLLPDVSEPVPAIIAGDGCWWYCSDDLAMRVVQSGCALVMFNRTELAEDPGHAGDVLRETHLPVCHVPDPERKGRRGGLYAVYPGSDFGSLAAWAWGYHRCVDLLHRLPFIDTARIAVSGHSRGGKTVLLAGATDERIAMVNDNASGTGGSGLYRYVGNGGETLNIAKVFPSWFGSRLHTYIGREGELPFDQHCLLAAIAPRPLLLTYALDDRWSNPEGMVQCAWAAGEVYGFLGHAEHLAFHLRPGAHSHSPDDWNVLLDFINWKWNGKPPQMPYNRHPYSHLRPAHDWKQPLA